MSLSSNSDGSQDSLFTRISTNRTNYNHQNHSPLVLVFLHKVRYATVRRQFRAIISRHYSTVSHIQMAEDIGMQNIDMWQDLDYIDASLADLDGSLFTIQACIDRMMGVLAQRRNNEGVVNNNSKSIEINKEQDGNQKS